MKVKAADELTAPAFSLASLEALREYFPGAKCLFVL